MKERLGTPGYVRALPASYGLENTVLAPSGSRSIDQGPLSPFVLSLGMKIWNVKPGKVEEGSSYSLSTRFQLQSSLDC